jgi:secreted Zn-dependent insulinase-like peptidase
MRVAFDVKDPKNDNSAFIAYYQTNIGNDDLKAELTFKIVSKYLSQPYFNELRTA